MPLDKGTLKSYLDEIQGPENIQRKRDHIMRADVYRERQRQYILDRLKCEFSAKTVAEMRTITSVNLTKRIVDELASVYRDAPKRSLTGATEEQTKNVESLYEKLCVNVKLKKANRVLKLHNQGTIWVVPCQGKIEIRVLAPHQYDVIPDPDNPEKPFAYVVSTVDRTQAGVEDAGADGINQKIADPDDYKKETLRFIWWTAKENFVTDHEGTIVSGSVENPTGVNTNPISALPFVDVSDDKDFEYWVRSGSAVVDFAIDFGVLLSDTANINRLQGYSQAVIYAKDMPESLTVGPNHVLRIPLDENATVQPKFEFVTPSPDMASSLELLETYLRLFLSSRGIDPKAISGKNAGERFSSGIERLLAMIEKFDASKDDFDQFKYVEGELFEIIRAWNNELQGTTLLDPEYKVGTIPDNIEFQATFSSPEIVQTLSEREDSAIKQIDAGLMSRVEGVAYIRQVDKERAEEIVTEIDKEDEMNKLLGADGGLNGGPDQQNGKQVEPQAQGQPQGATGNGAPERPAAT